jgi:LPPG:FO 2-phospho-L-lactate transferase
MKTMITALAGGVGAARFLTGVTQLVKQEDMSVIVNTGDDMEMFGLHISPDIDIITYTLAGIVDEEKGWGIKHDTFQCLDMLKKLGLDTWFALGDRDLATHIFRTNLLKKGFSLSQITGQVCYSLGLKVKVLPMTNEKFETWIKLEQGLIHFEEYFVKRASQDTILGVEFVGAAQAKASPHVIDSIMNSKMVVICPSNPIVSIGTILSVQGIRDALKKTDAKIVGVSPIVAGATIKGPADKMLRALGFEVSAFSVAKLYSDFLDVFVVDVKDSEDAKPIRELGVDVKVTDTIMKSLDDKVRLAKTVLES